MERERQRLKSEAILYQSERLDEVVPRNKTSQMRWAEAQAHGWNRGNHVRSERKKNHGSMGRQPDWYRSGPGFGTNWPTPQMQAPATPLTAANLSLYDYKPGQMATPQYMDNMSEASFFTNRWLPAGFSASESDF